MGQWWDSCGSGTSWMVCCWWCWYLMGVDRTFLLSTVKPFFAFLSCIAVIVIADVSYQHRFLTCSQRAPLVSFFCNWSWKPFAFRLRLMMVAEPFGMKNHAWKNRQKLSVSVWWINFLDWISRELKLVCHLRQSDKCHKGDCKVSQLAPYYKSQPQTTSWSPSIWLNNKLHSWNNL